MCPVDYSINTKALNIHSEEEKMYRRIFFVEWLLLPFISLTVKDPFYNFNKVILAMAKISDLNVK